MKAAFKTLLGLALVFSVAFVATAEEKKKEAKAVTLKGKFSCAKCTLDKTDKCTNAITVEKDGKEVVYYLEDMGNKEKYHKKICPANSVKPGKVTGVVSKKGDQLYIKPGKDGVKYDDDDK